MNNIEELTSKARIERLKSKFEIAKSYGSDQLTVPMPDLEALIAQLEAAQKLKGEQVPVDSGSFSLIEAACEQWKLVSIEANKKVAALGDENRKLRTEIAKINAD